MENKSKNLIPVIAILVAIIAVLGSISAYNLLTSVEKKETTATVIIDFGNETLWTFEDITTENNTVYGFLIKAAEEGNFSIKTTYYTGLGVFIDGIASVEHGIDIPGIADEDQRWWQYYINDALGPVAADRQKVNDNDVIEWKFEIPSW